MASLQTDSGKDIDLPSALYSPFGLDVLGIPTLSWSIQERTRGQGETFTASPVQSGLLLILSVNDGSERQTTYPLDTGGHVDSYIVVIDDPLLLVQFQNGTTGSVHILRIAQNFHRI